MSRNTRAACHVPCKHTLKRPTVQCGITGHCKDELQWGMSPSGGRFDIKMSSYQHRKSHCGDKTIFGYPGSYWLYSFYYIKPSQIDYLFVSVYIMISGELGFPIYYKHKTAMRLPYFVMGIYIHGKTSLNWKRTQNALDFILQTEFRWPDCNVGHQDSST